MKEYSVNIFVSKDKLLKSLIFDRGCLSHGKVSNNTLKKDAFRNTVKAVPEMQETGRRLKRLKVYVRYNEENLDIQN